jgi:hypothetical protein
MFLIIPTELQEPELRTKIYVVSCILLLNPPSADPGSTSFYANQYEALGDEMHPDSIFQMRYSDKIQSLSEKAILGRLEITLRSYFGILVARVNLLVGTWVVERMEVGLDLVLFSESETRVYLLVALGLGLGRTGLVWLWRRWERKGRLTPALLPALSLQLRQD